MPEPYQHKYSTGILIQIEITNPNGLLAISFIDWFFVGNYQKWKTRCL